MATGLHIAWDLDGTIQANTKLMGALMNDLTAAGCWNTILSGSGDDPSSGNTWQDKCDYLESVGLTTGWQDMAVVGGDIAKLKAQHIQSNQIDLLIDNDISNCQAAIDAGCPMALVPWGTAVMAGNKPVKVKGLTKSTRLSEQLVFKAYAPGVQPYETSLSEVRASIKATIHDRWCDESIARSQAGIKQARRWWLEKRLADRAESLARTAITRAQQQALLDKMHKQAEKARKSIAKSKERSRQALIKRNDAVYALEGKASDLARDTASIMVELAAVEDRIRNAPPAICKTAMVARSFQSLPPAQTQADSLLEKARTTFDPVLRLAYEEQAEAILEGRFDDDDE